MTYIDPAKVPSNLEEVNVWIKIETRKVKWVVREDVDHLYAKVELKGKKKVA